jgi:ATP citrate (pro-S)-lyase
MSNELNNIIARSTDGVYEGVAIGGDRYDIDNISNHHHHHYYHQPSSTIITIIITIKHQ